MSTLNINDNNFLRQFEVNINGQLAKVEYALQERKIFLTKIILPENTTDQFKEDFLVQIFEIINNYCSINTISKLIKTIPYEILTNLGKRYQRRYFHI